MEPPDLITEFGPPDSPARVNPPEREPLRIGLVQQRWHPDPAEHRAALAEGIRIAAGEGARLVCLQELTLSPYFAVTADALDDAAARAEGIPDGPTTGFAAELAGETGAHVHASLYERAGEGELGFNTAICVAPSGEVVARTRKQHIPVTAGYYEDHYFRPGDSGYPVVDLAGAGFGFPTCWDQWFPELARAYSLRGAEVIVYPTAIGSEPDHPDFDTEPLWERVITANGIANGTFMVAVNRIGDEPPLRFYGSSFISDPYGRVLVQAPRDRPAVLVADLDLDQRRDWLELFPFLSTRRPSEYAPLVAEHTSRAEVATDKPVAYMRQLCKHFGHKVDASFGEDSGYIRFEFGRCELHAADGALALEVSAGDAESHERMERVIGSHLERFGRRDGLSVAWHG